ncbi:hypothetical protein KAFR_0I01980 [Kazachstania africana CBS 2517]|uniref:PH-response regulator protein palI/RIM9 n=1 Tax=Kazachstania africana (strain ATCC 22294 / BCRC 22015 / CBS 2517 / CECT 1963 / NBRC 1671 / NRRL Y-8276) TaxID=1071382 RepID=H2B028_KAZAF|nr:hypothetical protein KAFR_0I01980 [Kazachstania africana CBS 2517]CCF59978.1 hypothetical protein KAFR_0I01980 [Kazachstania africana CBS 2517]
MRTSKSSIFFAIIAVFQFASMALLIICCITAPVFKQIGLSKYDGITYGVFGYCEDDSCSKASASYNPYALSDDTASWKMNSNARKALGHILIIMPVAAGLNFFAFLSTSITLIVSILQNYGNISAIMFIINLIFDLLGFLSSALMCIVSFLLFYPHTTWCTWILIPAAVLPLITLPLIFVAYISNGQNGTESNLEEQDEIMLYDQYNNTNSKKLSIDDIYNYYNDDDAAGSSNLLNKPTVPSDANPSTTDVEKDLYNVNNSATDLSTEEREKQEYTERVTAVNVSDEYVEKVQHGDNDDDKNSEKNSLTAFSAIENDTGAANNNGNNVRQNAHAYVPTASLNSSTYSHKETPSTDNPNRIIEDVMNNGPEDNTFNDDKRSDLTSISRRGFNQYKNNNIPPYPKNPSMSQPQSAIQQPMNYQQSGQYQQPMQYHQQYSVPPRQYLPSYHSVPQMTTMSDTILSNNPNFMPAPMSRNGMKSHQQRDNNTQANVNMSRIPNSTPHFQSAYKKRMQNKNNLYNTLQHSDNPYNFR